LRTILKKYLASVLLFSCTASIAGISYAQITPTVPQAELNFNANSDARDLRSNPQVGAKVTERQAVILARAKFSGNILRISLVGEGEHQRYQIRMENEGKVFTVFVHATTGEVVGGA
jgi:uncharacterized membrane protein YkoI